MTEPSHLQAVVLVEGIGDQRALTALARRRNRNLDAEGIAVVPIGGAHAIAASSIGSALGDSAFGLRVSAMPEKRGPLRVPSKVRVWARI